MILDSITAASLQIPFRRAFRHAAASRAETETLWIEALARNGTRGFGEGCPRSYVTGENLQSAARFVAAHHRSWLADIADFGELSDWVARHRPAIDRNPAAWAAVELALLDLLGKNEGRSVEKLLGLPELAGTFHYTAVLGDAAPPEFEEQLAQYLRSGFRDFKIKLSGDRVRDRSKVRALAVMGVSPASVRADANGLWRDASTSLRHLRALDYPFFAVEEPLSAGDFRGMRRIGSEMGASIVLDESLLRVDQLDRLGGHPDRWIVNLRASKMGGLLRSLELLRALRRLGCRVICGAHVGETSLLTRAALTVARETRELLAGQEGAFGTRLLTADVTDDPVMFGPGGVLEVAASRFSAPGLGIAIACPPTAALIQEQRIIPGARAHPDGQPTLSQ